jgi:hypothetical protein
MKLSGDRTRAVGQDRESNRELVPSAVERAIARRSAAVVQSSFRESSVLHRKAPSSN